MKALFLISLLIKFMGVSAQCITFTYDAAGDRTARNICPQALQGPSAQELSKSEVPVQFTTNESDVLVFPNPTDGILEIRSDYFSSDSKILVTDILGRRFYSGKLSDNRIDLSRFQAGRYFVRIMEGERVRVVQVIKQ